MFVLVAFCSLVFLLYGGGTYKWFKDILPPASTVAKWSASELDNNLFRLSRWDSFLGHAQFHRFVVEQIKGLNLSRYDQFKYLEVGVGVGAFAREMMSMFPLSTCHGIDVVPEAIEIAKVVLPSTRSTLRVENMLDLDEEDGEFDYVLVPGAVCYLDSMFEVREAVRGFLRVLKNGGGLCLSMIPADTNHMGSCNTAIPKSFWYSPFVKVLSMDEMDDWNLPHAYGRYSTCMRKIR